MNKRLAAVAVALVITGGGLSACGNEPVTYSPDPLYPTYKGSAFCVQVLPQNSGHCKDSGLAESNWHILTDVPVDNYSDPNVQVDSDGDSPQEEASEHFAKFWEFYASAAVTSAYGDQALVNAHLARVNALKDGTYAGLITAKAGERSFIEHKGKKVKKVKTVDPKKLKICAVFDGGDLLDFTLTGVQATKTTKAAKDPTKGPATGQPANTKTPAAPATAATPTRTSSTSTAAPGATPTRTTAGSHAPLATGAVPKPRKC